MEFLGWFPAVDHTGINSLPFPPCCSQHPNAQKFQGIRDFLFSWPLPARQKQFSTSVPLEDLLGPAGLQISAELHMVKIKSSSSPNGNIRRDDTRVSAALTGGRKRSRVEQDLPGLHWYTGPSPELSVQPELASVPSPSEMLSAPFRTGSTSCSPSSSMGFTDLSSEDSLSSWSPWLIFSCSDSSTLSPEGSSASSSASSSFFSWSTDRGRGLVRNTLANSMHVKQLFMDSHSTFGSTRKTNASYTEKSNTTLSHWVIYQLIPMDNPLIINGATGKTQHCPGIGWRELLSHEQSQPINTTLLSSSPTIHDKGMVKGTWCLFWGILLLNACCQLEQIPLRKAVWEPATILASQFQEKALIVSLADNFRALQGHSLIVHSGEEASECTSPGRNPSTS